jgi:hypothetical protein
MLCLLQIAEQYSMHWLQLHYIGVVVFQYRDTLVGAILLLDGAPAVRGDEAATDTTVSARTPPSVLEVDRAHFVTPLPLRTAMWRSSGKTWLDGA